MRWEVETWRKLYVRVDAKWLRLPVSARGLANELLKYCDDEGRIDIGDDPPGLAIAYLLSARPGEHKRIAQDVDLLLSSEHAFLLREPRALVIRNFQQAQGRKGSAERMARKRFRERQGDAPVTSPDASQVTSQVTGGVTSQDRHSMTSQSDGSRSDPDPDPRSPPTPPLGGVGSTSQVGANGQAPPAPADPEPVHDDLRLAYAQGVTAATANPYTPPQKREEAWVLEEAVKTHGGGRKGEELLTWLREQAKAYVLAKREDSRFERGFAPSKFAEWLNTRAVAKPGGAGGAAPKELPNASSRLPLEQPKPLAERYRQRDRMYLERTFPEVPSKPELKLVGGGSGGGS